MKLKRISVFVVIFILMVFRSWGEDREKYKYFVLDGGIKVFLEERDKIPLNNIVFGINLGSKDEGNESNGLVHLLEHLILMRGTHSYTSNELIEKIRENGLYFNAHTGHDLMTFEISVPSSHTEFAFDLLHEKIFRLKLTQEEMEKEKKVILEELSQIQDDPDKLQTSLALQALFAGHPYEKQVGGEKEIIENVSIEVLESFYKKYFISSNFVLSMVGDFKIEKMEKEIKRIFGKYKSPDIKHPGFKKISPLKKNVKIERELDITQAYLTFGFIAPCINDPDKLSMDILVQILAKGVNPLLYRAFVGKRRLVESLETRFISLKYGGAILIQLILKPKNLKQAKTRLLEFLKRTRTFRYSKEDYLYPGQFHVVDYLETAKTWMRFAHEQYKEQALNMASSYARFMLTHDNSEQKSYKDRMEAIKSSDLRKTATEYLSGKKYVMVSIIPKKK